MQGISPNRLLQGNENGATWSEAFVRYRLPMIGNDKDLVAVLRHHLVGHGHDVIYTLDGTEGPVIAARDLPDLVISDTEMPDSNGLAQAAELRSDSSTDALPIILLTKTDDAKMLALAMRFGVNQCLRKPVARDTLPAAVAASLERVAAPAFAA